MNQSPAVMRDAALSGAKGDGVGLVLGAVIGALTYRSRVKNQARIDALDISVVYLQTDATFLQSVLELRVYRKLHPPQSEHLFECVVQSCDCIVECYLGINTRGTVNPGVLRYRAHRMLKHVTDGLRALGRLTRQPGNSSVDDEMLQQFETIAATVGTCADNYIHNMILIDRQP
jgi:hypothetical protein